MTRTSTLEIAGGARVVTPDSLNLITPYVLYEQQDWFEDEIVYLRRLLLPGQRAIDVGANYGVYTLSIAQAVGPTGAKHRGQQLHSDRARAQRALPRPRHGTTHH
jgi:hypothetical protein